MYSARHDYFNTNYGDSSHSCSITAPGTDDSAIPCPSLHAQPPSLRAHRPQILDGDLQIDGWDHSGATLWPFDQQHGIEGQQVAQSQRFDFARSASRYRSRCKSFGPSTQWIAFDQCVSRAAASQHTPSAFSTAPASVDFSRPEIAMQVHDGARRDATSQHPSERFCRGGSGTTGGMRSKLHHRSALPDSRNGGRCVNRSDGQQSPFAARMRRGIAGGGMHQCAATCRIDMHRVLLRPHRRNHAGQQSPIPADGHARDCPGRRWMRSA